MWNVIVISHNYIISESDIMISTLSSVWPQLVLSILNLKVKSKSLEIFLKTLSGQWLWMHCWFNVPSFRPSCRDRRAGTSWWAGWCTASTPGRDGGWWGTPGRRATWRRARRRSTGRTRVNSQIHPSTTASGKTHISTDWYSFTIEIFLSSMRGGGGRQSR